MRRDDYKPNLPKLKEEDIKVSKMSDAAFLADDFILTQSFYVLDI